MLFWQRVLHCRRLKKVKSPYLTYVLNIACIFSLLSSMQNKYVEHVVGETYTPSSRSGLRTRGRQMNLRERNKKDFRQTQPKVETLWLPENQIELWQIRQFDSL